MVHVSECRDGGVRRIRESICTRRRASPVFAIADGVIDRVRSTDYSNLVEALGRSQGTATAPIDTST